MTAVAVVWKRSPWGGWVHAFEPAKIGELVAEALCTHSAGAGRLSEPADGDTRCPACLMLHGGQLADRHDERGAPPQWPL